MFKKIIESCYAELKSEDHSDAKKMFGFIWAVFASKKVKFNDGEVSLSWRELSAELAVIYNEWFDTSFTTDAFLGVTKANYVVGEDDWYDDMLMRVYRHTDCVGIFEVRNGPSVRAEDEFAVFMEVNIVTDEKNYYKQAYDKGHCVGNPERISDKEYESLCYSVR